MVRVTFDKLSYSEYKKLNYQLRIRIDSVLNRFTKGHRVDINKKKGDTNEYRIRVGDYRIILAKISSTEYRAIRIQHRKKVYKN